jgi:PAS domain-containing protein
MSDPLIPLESYLRTVVDAIPDPLFVVDGQAQVLDINQAALMLVGGEDRLLVRRLMGDVLQCVNAIEAPDGCGSTGHCKDCVIRNAILAAVEGQRRTRQVQEMVVDRGSGPTKLPLQVTASPLTYNDTPLALLVLEDVSELMELRGILPICSACKKVRRDDQYWEQVESYIKRHSAVDFTHTLCPECLEELYPEFDGKQD